MAELIGAILGDGHIHKKNNLITITGSLEDLEYYQDRITVLFRDLFSQKSVIRKRTNQNSYYLMVYSKEIVGFLTNQIGLKRGAKNNTTIPGVIMSNKKLSPHFLRGLFDTDGCIKFSKQKSNENHYPRIQIALKKSPIAYQLKALFKKLNFNYGSWEDDRFSGTVYYQISGKKNTERWFKEISPQNQVHVTKYLFWKKYGHCIPKSTLKQRRLSLP